MSDECTDPNCRAHGPTVQKIERLENEVKKLHSDLFYTLKKAELLEAQVRDQDELIEVLRASRDKWKSATYWHRPDPERGTTLEEDDES